MEFPPFRAALAFLLVFLLGSSGFAQEPAQEEEADEVVQPSDEVRVVPDADDTQIAARLRRILDATGWFTEADVSVDEGVVFLRGATHSAEHRQWAAKLASSAQDVGAVVHRIRVTEPSAWDVEPAWREFRRLAATVLHRRVRAPLLRQVSANLLALPVLLVGLYVTLRISGLTQLALTVLGGTGIAGLIIGIAFRDIAENFLASALISTQRPFRAGDLIDVGEHEGHVQRVTLRGTLLMTLEGNHVQVPNATIYKSAIVNKTANVNIRKVRSAVIRQVKAAFQAAGVSMPDAAREGVFPDGVPIHRIEAGEPTRRRSASQSPPGAASEESEDATEAEGDLASEADDIARQAEQSRIPEEGENLLADDSR